VRCLPKPDEQAKSRTRSVQAWLQFLHRHEVHGEKQRVKLMLNGTRWRPCQVEKKLDQELW
jgi:putative AlgH/UPF0301 family transcriptional regulator